MSKMLNILLEKMDKNVTGYPNSRLYRTRSDWETLEEETDWACCSEENAGIFGEVFLVRDIVFRMSWPKTFYSFRSRHNYPKIKDMTEKQLMDCFDNYVQHQRYDCSPFGCGSDQEWSYEYFKLDGKNYIFTYGYMGS